MKHKLSIGIAILLLASPTLACSLLRLKQPLSWHITLQIDSTGLDQEAATKQAVRVIQGRLNALGISNSQVEAEGAPANGRIIVRLPDVPDRERLKKLLTDEGRLELAHVASPPSPAPVQTYNTKEEANASLGGTVPANRRVLPYRERDEPTASVGEPATDAAQKQKKWVVVKSPVVVDGSELRTATAIQLPGGANDYQIAFSLKPAGAEKFGAWTASNINEHIAVVYNGEVKSIAYIKSQITDQGEISGRFTKEAANDLALILSSGQLPGPVRIVAESANK